MKNVIYIILIVFSFTSYGQNVYYVAPSGGSDGNAGTIGSPWATWNKAFNTAQAGDTVYFRGGVWYPTSFVQYDPLDGKGYNGTYSAPIHYFNYPGETPILDCTNYPYTGDKAALAVHNVTYVKFRGLTIRNNKQIVNDQWVSGIEFVDMGVYWLDQCVSHGHGGYGMYLFGYDTAYVTNNDSYSNYDSLPTDPGNRADGFTFTSGGTYADTLKYFLFTGNRSWNNSDDGFEFNQGKPVDIYNNWAWNNGRANGEGHAFKSSAGHTVDPWKRKVHHNLSAFNKGYSYAEFTLKDPDYGPVMVYYNNTSYKNNVGFGAGYEGYNFCVLGGIDVRYYNNLVYDSKTAYLDQFYLDVCAYGYPSYAVMSNNTFILSLSEPYWAYNPSVTVTDDDFVLVDSTLAVAELSAARKPDGSLPDITFLTLAEGSDLIDAGMDVGFDYRGDAPDLGWDEYGDGSTATNILTFVLSDQTGAATINTTNHTVDIEVVYTADITDLTPTITLSYGATVIPLSGVARDFTNPVPYTVTAEDGVTNQEWTVTVTQEAEPEEPPVASTGRIVKFNGKIVKR